MTEQKNVALVTGASSGIGKAIAEQLLADGLVVYGAARRLEKMADLKRHGAIALEMDITKEGDVARVIDQIVSEVGGVDVLVNNAGFGNYGAMEDTSIEDAKYQFDVNLFGLARITKAVLPHMREQKRGKIVNISSMAGKMYMPMGAWYHGSKHALEGWSDCLRLELDQFGIDVIIIEPGVIETEFDDSMIGPMMERSGNTAYSELANKVKVASIEAYGEGTATPASAVAKTVSQAIKSRKPKTRYIVGKMARPMIFARKWLGDRLFDKIVEWSI
ncbi:oxidoreductase [Bythopirellula polymerisocia]|uniref:Putative ketoacyl reductase n=1 Tax=Bythopirellula polymerisocia TaxID=2528003 RepID=A0A5C6CXL9_9BACT|nr:oxidoreductase [Bythopirellula polymerisocia]TWU29352.1 putative ketoacyl reductase [Bythopirellula polymerisocia]